MEDEPQDRTSLPNVRLLAPVRSTVKTIDSSYQHTTIITGKREGDSLPIFIRRDANVDDNLPIEEYRVMNLAEQDLTDPVYVIFTRAQRQC
ncbi:hypothetical protein BC938DRAFT_474374 [Jimgerdemannia flammicorona]|uniref:Uncharacterized protein n=1 Tax=Jimgerdemannia flammicorona TaxID=994334 RepID=A0A433Q2D8_9FUNG|nr:hypothetical protein BC938DRAFT_474374 [Jimgerdemannia flammicorona]